MMSYEGTLFPLDRQLAITEDTKPLTENSTLKVYVQLAEDNIFLQGFDDNSHEGRPPTLLRGALVVRVLKQSKFKSVSLTFKGVSKTDWPEGIPPKKSEYSEANVVMTHTWPFYTQTSDRNQSGADILKSPQALYTVLSNDSLAHDDVTSLNLDAVVSKGNALSLLKRVASPERKRSNSASAFSIRSDDTAEANQHYTFEPGDYIYNFEHPIPASAPETIEATFGSVRYYLEVSIERQGAFKSNIMVRTPVHIVRAQADESVEDSEPIAISRDWENQLHYDILIASKAMILNAYLPIAFKLIPLDKIKLHRIRIYLTENIEYYCRNKKVHRMEPTKKYLLLEHKAPPPQDSASLNDPKAKKMGNLLTSDGYDLTAKEFEFQVFVPQKLQGTQRLHPNTSYANIKSHHWIKICLRLSRIIDGNPKHYEISIDSPIHVLDSLCSHANTLLPAYGVSQYDTSHNHESNIYFPMEVLDLPPMSPEVVPVESNHRNIYMALSHDQRSGSASSLSHTLPNFESTLSANVYKPHDLAIELTSPQAIPLSPLLSPMLSIASQPLDDEPPAFESFELSPSMPSGIDAIMDQSSPPKHPPRYEDVVHLPRSPILAAINSAPQFEVTRSSTSPETSPDDPNDLAMGFTFQGHSHIMPSSVIRATSPHAQNARASVRSAASTPKASMELNRDGAIMPMTHENDELSDDAEISSNSSSVAGSPVLYTEGDIADMTPLLEQTTRGSSVMDYPMRLYSSRLQSLESFSRRDSTFGDQRFVSMESLGRRNSATVDISALYQSPQHMFTENSLIDSVVDSPRQSLSAPEVRPPNGIRRRSSVQVVTPVLAILNDEPEENILEETESGKSHSDSSVDDPSMAMLENGNVILPKVQVQLMNESRPNERVNS